jgi:hypothetical protein
MNNPQITPITQIQAIDFLVSEQGFWMFSRPAGT